MSQMFHQVRHEFFQQRLGDCLVADLDPVTLEKQLTAHLAAANSSVINSDFAPALRHALSDIIPIAQAEKPIEFDVFSAPMAHFRTGSTTLVIHTLPAEAYEGRKLGLGCSSAGLIAVLPYEESDAVRIIKNVVEAWWLNLKNNASQAALAESAMQLAQSFEEQNWLRNFAQHASRFSKTVEANEIAEGILQPLVYLLRASDVYLLATPHETARSGLTSAKFSTSPFSLQTIASVFNEYQLDPVSKPVVKNNMSIATSDGIIDSIVAVAANDSGLNRGYLVAINRNTESKDGRGNLPVYDREFGSVEVGILEEAAVLLTTQAQNLQLLLQSNQLFLGTLHAMSSAIDARDRYTQGHSERVARLAHDLAQIHSLSVEACHEIYLAGILHDIGKIGVPDRVLLKSGRLTDEEFAIIQKHPEIGHRIVESLEHLQFTLPGVLHHHERWDGKGYPHGLEGDSIPLMARILAVADGFDAMTSCRPYRSAMPVTKAHSIINAGAAEQWDAEIVECFNIWYKKRTKECTTKIENDSVTPSLIPMDGPLEQMASAVTALI